MYEGICEALHREMDMLEEKYSNSKSPMNAQDLEHIDKMAHALKDLRAVEGMEGHSEWDGSYARGRSRVTGRYVSRDDGYDSRDYRRY